MTIQENISLSRFTSLHIGGPARYFIDVETDDDVIAALQFAHQQQLPFFILGKGSNTLFPDEGYRGVVIHMTNRQLTRHDNTITATSGVFMRQLVNFALDSGLRGLEELAGIPGTVGGAVRGNAGTWQTEMKDYLTKVDILRPRQEADLSQWEAVSLDPADCHFGYRHSVFKEQPHWIILKAHLTLQPGDVTVGQQLVLKDVQERHARQPYTAPSAGSIFKNPDKAAGIYSGRLIEEAGLKGTTRGGAQISEKHGNFIINQGQATSADIRYLIRLIQSTVAQRTGIDLEPEIVIISPEEAVRSV